MNEVQVSRNRRITGTLLAIRNAPAGDYDMDRFFARADDFFETPNIAAFSMLLAARLVGEQARAHKGLPENAMVALGMPAAANQHPDILLAFRLAVVIMNKDVAMAQALVDTAAKSRSRSRNVLACLVGMLTEAPPPA